MVDAIEKININNKKIDPFTFILFLSLGSGCNWVLPNALFQELPYFQQISPEGTCLATYMNLSLNFGVVIVILYLFYIKIFGKESISYTKLIPFLLIVSSLGTFFAAFTYQIIINNISLFIYISSAIGGCVGSLTSVIFYPYLMKFDPDYISAARLGGSSVLFLCAIISIYQDPGSSSNIKFTSTIYLFIFGVILVFSLPAYYTIEKYKLGLKDNNFNNIDIKINDETLKSSLILEMDSCKENEKNKIIINDYTQKLCEFIGASEITASWLRIIWPYCWAVCFIDFQTFGFITSFAPFAFKNSTNYGGAEYLSRSLQLGGFGVIFGDFSTIYFRLPLLKTLIIYSILTMTIYIGASDVVNYHHDAIPYILVIISGLIRFLEAHVITSCFRAISTEVPKEHKDNASRMVGLMDQLGETFGNVISALIVSQSFSC
jgi:hypothetical protein